jgi:riboflavin synthase alpha subunit
MAAGDGVNIECDILSKYVESLLDKGKDGAAPRLTVGRLIEEGF